MDINIRITELERRINDLLAQLVAPLQQLAAMQAQLELLKELKKEKEDEKAEGE